MKKAIVLVGLGFGDEGKGGACDHLCRQLQADLVVRYSGGSQCGHNVQLPDGRRHTFSQFGAGTLVGVPTYLGPQVIINPTALRNEANHLTTVMEIPRLDALLSIHPRCLVSTIFHQLLNRSRELARMVDVRSVEAEDYGPVIGQQHGSCGHGIGETRHYWLKYGADAIVAQDLRHKDGLGDKLELLKQRCLMSFSEIVRINKATDSAAASVMQHLHKINIKQTAQELCDAVWPYEFNAILPDYSMAIFEGAQGVLLDEWYGFHPYTTWSTVTPQHALELLATQPQAADYKILGLTRSYLTRHGAGPFPSYNKELTHKLPDPGNPQNCWQGVFMCGWLDFVLLQRSIKACGKIDGLVVSCLDQVDDDFYCVDSYDYKWNHFNYIDAVMLAEPNYALDKGLTNWLSGLGRPSSVKITLAGLREKLKELAPIVSEGHGPTHEHRTLNLAGL